MESNLAVDRWIKQWQTKERILLLRDIEYRIQKLQRQIRNFRINGQFRKIREAKQLIGFLRNFDTEIRKDLKKDGYMS